MANTIINITSNDIKSENENLIVYRDISMTSTFNPHAANLTEAGPPDINNYYTVLASEKDNSSNTRSAYIILNGEYNNINHSVIGDCQCAKLLSDNKFEKDNERYIGKISLSKYRIEKNINVKAVQQSIHNIFSWIPGERILNPEFGSVLYRQLYNGITEFNTEQIIAEIQHTVSEWEPRANVINIQNVSTMDDVENNTIHLEIIYTIPTLSDKEYSYTYTYHKTEL